MYQNLRPELVEVTGFELITSNLLKQRSVYLASIYKDFDQFRPIKSILKTITVSRKIRRKTGLRSLRIDALSRPFPHRE